MVAVPPIRTDFDHEEDHDHMHDDDLIDDEEYDEGDSLELTAEAKAQLAHQRMLDDFLSPLILDEAVLYKLARRFSTVYRHLALTSNQQFLPTPVTRLPNGNETGRYLAIDVGGSNLRVSFIELLGEAADADIRSTDASEKSRDTMRKAQRQRVRRTLEKAWPIQEHLKLDKAEDLFSWIGDCIAEVVAESLTTDSMRGNVPEELDMGITFSFPIMQESLSEATLMPMGKGFAITSDLNLRKILLNGYEKHTKRLEEEDEPTSKRRKLFSLPKLKIAAITNDTVATLASLAYEVKSLPNSRVAMGIIVGTGCNATIPMKLNALHESKAKRVSSTSPGAEDTVVNTEWTISGAAQPLEELGIITKWDIELDRACARPGFQPFEYMTGGRYIGELIRLILYDYLTNHAKVSKKDLPSQLVKEYALSTTYISQKVARTRSDIDLVSELNCSLVAPKSEWKWDATSAGAFRKIARTVQRRSAGLIAAAVVGLLACAREIELKVDSNENSPQDGSLCSLRTAGCHGTGFSPFKPDISKKRGDTLDDQQHNAHGPIVPVLTPAPADWQSGPEELVVAYTGGIIQSYPNFKEMCQQYIDRLIMRTGPQKSGKSVFLREASNGGIIGAGVLAGMVVDG